MAKAARKKQPKSSFPWLWILGAAAVLILTGALVLPRLLAVQAGLPAEVNTTRGYEMREEGAFVLDVRQPEEWNETHIPGATLIPLGELAARISEVPTGVPVLVYCRSGNRSQEGRDILKAAGLQEVTSLAGGIRAWSAAGYATESGQ